MNEERRSPHPMLVEMHGDVKVLAAKIESIDERLFGNGQPGELHQIKNRISKLEKWMWGLGGAGIVAGFILKLVLK